MIEMQLENHLVIDSYCNIIIYNAKKIHKEWQIIVGLQFEY